MGLAPGVAVDRRGRHRAAAQLHRLGVGEVRAGPRADQARRGALADQRGQRPGQRRAVADDRSVVEPGGLLEPRGALGGRQRSRAGADPHRLGVGESLFGGLGEAPSRRFVDGADAQLPALLQRQVAGALGRGEVAAHRPERVGGRRLRLGGRRPGDQRGAQQRDDETETELPGLHDLRRCRTRTVALENSGISRPGIGSPGDMQGRRRDSFGPLPPESPCAQLSSPSCAAPLSH